MSALSTELLSLLKLVAALAAVPAVLAMSMTRPTAPMVSSLKTNLLMELRGAFSRRAFTDAP